MQYLGERMHRFDVRPNNPVLDVEKWRKVAASDVAILVNGGREDGTLFLLIPCWVVASAAEKGNPIWCAGDDHGAPC